jgi:uncharacterized protein (DUF1778 family)
MAVSSDIQRYEIQWDKETHQLAERAAAAGGYGSIKALLIQLVKQHAPQVLASQQSVVLSNQQFDEFNRLCQTSVKPSNKVKEAVKALDEEGFSFNVNP